MRLGARGAPTAFALATLLSACAGTPRSALPPSASANSTPGTASARAPSRPARFDPASVRLGLRVAARGLDHPLFVAGAGDARLFVIEQAGRIRIVRGGRLAPAPFLDISRLVRSGGERGLLGLAFHPDYAGNGRLFVDYTDLRGDTVVAEYRRGSDPDRAAPASARVLLRIGQPHPNHNGGMLAFGPDGHLWIGTGDGGSGGDPRGNGQRLDTLLGKILRIDVDAPQRPYGIPRDNPFVGRRGARPEIWAYGLRNPWRFSFDRATGDLWIADVGQDRYEEIDLARAPLQAGLNFGWNRMEGSACFKPSTGCSTRGLARPIATYSHRLGCSATGGYVYRGRAFPALRGAYLFGDYCSGRIWALVAAGPGPQRPVEMLDTGYAISSFGEDASGELYLADLASGEIVRVSATQS